MKFYKVIAVPALIYDSDTWTLTGKDNQRIQFKVMKFLRTEGCTLWDQWQNKDIRADFEIYSINERIQDSAYRKDGKQERYKKLIHYIPEGRRGGWIEDRTGF